MRKILKLIKEYYYMRDTVNYARMPGVTVGENCKILSTPEKHLEKSIWQRALACEYW